MSYTFAQALLLIQTEDHRRITVAEGWKDDCLMALQDTTEDLCAVYLNAQDELGGAMQREYQELLLSALKLVALLLKAQEEISSEALLTTLRLNPVVQRRLFDAL